MQTKEVYFYQNMSTSSNIAAVIPVFTGEHYHIWVVNMRFYLRSQELWNMVTTDVDTLSVNPTLAQIRAHEEEKLKKDKAITCFHSAFADHFSTKIMDLETPKSLYGISFKVNLREATESKQFESLH